MNAPARISLIVPTRKRPESLGRLLASLAATTDHPHSLEIVLVIDADDPESTRVSHEKLAIRHVVVPPGQTMGALNRAGAAASTGSLLMLLNDDVIARTPGWDTAVRTCFAAFLDGILLVHVNDAVFQKALCTFPIVSRTFCELAGGICPAEYRRYRIDDHVEEIFNLLGVLGERRSLYLPDIIFEHANHVTNADGVRQYFSEPTTLAIDAARFDETFDERKRITLALMEHLQPRASERRRAAWQAKLDGVTDGFALRTPGRLRVVEAHELMGGCLSRRESWFGELRRRARKCVREKGYRGLADAVMRRLVRSPAAPR